MALVYAQSGDLSFVALGKNLGDGMLNEPLLLAGFGLMIGICQHNHERYLDWRAECDLRQRP